MDLTLVPNLTLVSDADLLREMERRLERWTDAESDRYNDAVDALVAIANDDTWGPETLAVKIAETSLALLEEGIR
jgi:hypothetical protein